VEDGLILHGGCASFRDVDLVGIEKWPRDWRPGNGRVPMPRLGRSGGYPA
jgi:hypothetical protein